jgi:hypothetical protein
MMASRGFRSNEDQLSEELLPIDYHGLETEGKLRDHTEQFRIAKKEIVQGKRRRRNSTSDSRNLATIRAAGPDDRFEDIAIADSGLRDGLAATRFMPSYPNVQDYTRRSARWGDLEQASTSEENEVQDSSALDSLSDDEDFPIKTRRAAKGLKQTSPSDLKSTTMKTITDATRGSAGESTSKAPTTDGIFYRCYATGCNYEHARRGNFSIHWKRDAKHPGTFELKKVLQCTRDHNGNITTTPYGNISTHRQRLSLAIGHEVRLEEKSISASSSDVEVAAPESNKIKTPAAGSRKSTRTASTAGPVTNQETARQDHSATTQEFPAQTSQTSSMRNYSSLECKIFKKLVDVPEEFPTDLTPLITHGVPDSTADYRFFCPECEKCFTQTHNVASHFTRHHGGKYSKNDRARTVFCRVTISNLKPIDDTILPRLKQIRQQRTQAVLSQAAASISARVADFHTQEEAPLDLTSNFEVDTAKPLFTSSQSTQPGLASFPTASTSQGAIEQEQSPRGPSQRVQRMHAVRQSILARNPGSYTAAMTNEAVPAINNDANNQHEGLQTAGIFGIFRTSIPEAGSIATSTRQPAWDAVSQPSPRLHGQKRKRTEDSYSTVNEEIACTDDEMDSETIPPVAENATQIEKHVGIEGSEVAQRPAKRQRTLIDYLGLQGYASD